MTDTMTLNLPHDPLAVGVFTRAAAQAKYGAAKITTRLLHQAVEDLRHLFNLDTLDAFQDVERQEAKMVLLDFIIHATRELAAEK